MLSKTWIRAAGAALLLAFSPLLWAQGVSVSVSIAPPELPVYDQPPIPGDGYLWTPGYWAWDDGIQDYYWVPGTWVEAPQPDYLWTPGYWGFANGVYLWNAGYWGPTVGFYGGVNYGFGYGGRGYEGGYWQGGHIFYNRAVVNVGSVHITNVYNKTVVNNVTVNRVSFNGGNGGIRAQATEGERAAARDRHIEATSAQRQQIETARANPQLRAAANHGRPPIAATPRAGNFSNPVAPRATGGAGEARSNPEPRPSTPQQRVNTERPQETAPTRDITAPRQPAAPQQRTTPTERANQPRQPAPVEPRRQPEQTQQPRPAAPKPQPQPREAPRPAEHPERAAEHPEEHEHH
jgi:hypothetical protein